MEKSAAIQAFVESYSRNRPRYRSFTLGFVHNTDAADEIVDNTFAHFWEKREEIDVTKLESYFFAALKNNCLHWLRSQQTQSRIRNEIYDKSYRLRQYDISSLDAFDPNLIFTREIRDITIRQLKLMPGLSRNIFLDSRFNCLNYDEIAEKYGVSKIKVKREVYAALSRLRIALKDYFPVILIFALLFLNSTNILTGLF